MEVYLLEVCEEFTIEAFPLIPRLSGGYMSFYYDWSKIETYNCPLKIVVSRRGLGKTFGKVKMCIERFITKGFKFIYVVETGEMVKELARNSGEKFWNSILEYYAKRDTSRKRYFYDKLSKIEIEEDENNGKDESELFYTHKTLVKVIGGTIKINGDTSGYIVDMNSFGELKRNNFNGVKYIVVDEFISERLDKTSLENPRKISSIIQSIGRLRDIKIYMLGNSIRLDDPILSRMRFKINKYGWYYKRDEYGLFAVLHFVDPKDYTAFAEAHNKSVAGRMAKMLGETNEEENVFISDLPANRRIVRFDFKNNGFRVTLVRGNTLVSLKELKNGCIACVPFTGRNTSNLYCFNEKEQGFKLGYHIRFDKNIKSAVMDMIKANIIYYYSEIEYNQLKIIIKGE